MPKQIILYNLKDGVTDEDYQKWCESFKGPLLLSLNASKSFTLVKMFGGMKGDGRKPNPPQETPSPFNYIGILDVTSLEESRKDAGTKAFKEDFFPKWISDWVADFYVLVGEEAYEQHK
jgi:hypothetical protein